MSAVALSSSSNPAKLPTGPNVATVIDEICRSMGVAPSTAEEIANLPPWTEEEANAFERTINEAFEQVEESAPP
jgi:hypothetical protein